MPKLPFDTIKYWQTKQKQLLAGFIAGRRCLTATGLGLLAALLMISATVGIWTAREKEQARQIPLRPFDSDRFVPAEPIPEAAAAVGNALPVAEKNHPAAVQPGASPACWPVAGEALQVFGWQQHPILKDWRYHPGIDLSAEKNELVMSALSGQVEAIRQDRRSGLTVIVYAFPWRVYHGSLSTVCVQPGTAVKAGQIIGTAGETFTHPKTHVYLSVEKEGKYLDPAQVLPER